MRVAIGLGCSLGDRRAMLELAVRKLAAAPDLQLIRVSRWYRTPPMRGGAARGWFLNGVATFETTATLEALLLRCRALERAAGRRRSNHWGDRPLDLDILVAEGAERSDETLQVPHPGIAQRSFVLFPLLEIWADATDARGLLYADFAEPDLPMPAPVGVMGRSPR